MTAPVTVYVSIGNSDGKLSPAEWAGYWELVHEVLTKLGLTSAVHGVWHSAPASPFVNACWCVEVKPEHAGAVKGALADLAARHRQDSVAWAECPSTEFIAAARGDLAGKPLP